MPEPAADLARRTPDALLLPAKPELITAEQAIHLERRAAAFVPTITNLEEAQEKRRQADALEAYLAGTEAHPYMQGITRRMEARIGELLGPEKSKRGRGHKSPHAGNIDSQRVGEFRALASRVRRGMLKYEMNGDDSPWRSSRRALLLGSGAFSAEATGEYEWYTPAEYIETARRVMGGIDLDPASSAEANEVIGAERYYSAEDDGLAHRWIGRVWMNPPYSRPLVDNFCAKLCDEYTDGNVTQAITLTYAATETGWFHGLAEVAAVLALPRGRIPYWSPRDGGSAPLKGSALFYLGPAVESFRSEFMAHGITAVL
jgi:phage N-6-adenine-methyltransferase